MIDILGLIGATLFAVTPAPVVWRTVRAGKHQGMPGDAIILFLTGMLFMGSYLILRGVMTWVLAVDYAVEGLMWGTLLTYWLRSLRCE